MSPKAAIYISITVFSTIGSWLGELIGGGWLGFWSLGLGTVGCFVGIWAGWKFSKMF